MNTINCKIRINEYQDNSGVGVTPAEAIVLREIHAPSLAQQAKIARTPEEKNNCWGFLTHVKAGAVALLDQEEGAKGKRAPRSNAEEIQRLRAKYLMRAKSGAQGSHILDDIFPGQNPDLPQTFEEIGLKVEAPADKKE